MAKYRVSVLSLTVIVLSLFNGLLFSSEKPAVKSETFDVPAASLITLSGNVHLTLLPSQKNQEENSFRVVMTSPSAESVKEKMIIEEVSKSLLLPDEGSGTIEQKIKRISFFNADETPLQVTLYGKQISAVLLALNFFSPEVQFYKPYWPKLRIFSDQPDSYQSPLSAESLIAVPWYNAYYKYKDVYKYGGLFRTGMPSVEMSNIKFGKLTIETDLPTIFNVDKCHGSSLSISQTPFKAGFSVDLEGLGWSSGLWRNFVTIKNFQAGDLSIANIDTLNGENIVVNNKLFLSAARHLVSVVNLTRCFVGGGAFELNKELTKMRHIHWASQKDLDSLWSFLPNELLEKIRSEHKAIVSRAQPSGLTGSLELQIKNYDAQWNITESSIRVKNTTLENEGSLTISNLVTKTISIILNKKSRGKIVGKTLTWPEFKLINDPFRRDLSRMDFSQFGSDESWSKFLDDYEELDALLGLSKDLRAPDINYPEQLSYLFAQAQKEDRSGIAELVKSITTKNEPWKKPAETLMEALNVKAYSPQKRFVNLIKKIMELAEESEREKERSRVSRSLVEEMEG